MILQRLPRRRACGRIANVGYATRQFLVAGDPSFDHLSGIASNDPIDRRIRDDHRINFVLFSYLHICKEIWNLELSRRQRHLI